MSKRVLSAIGWGFVGFAVALVLTVGTFALAGQGIAKPATPAAFLPSSEHTEAPEHGSRSPEADKSDAVSPSPDDDGGNPGTGSDDGGGSDDNSGPGSSSSGSGSDDDSSGSGSDDDSSGSGSDDDEEPEDHDDEADDHDDD